MITPVQFFKCLSDETRLNSILFIFLEGELCVCELMIALEESQPKVSRHLAQLRNCGLLQDRRKGQWVFYALHPKLPPWIAATLENVSNEHKEKIEPQLKKLKAIKERPDRC